MKVYYDKARESLVLEGDELFLISEGKSLVNVDSESLREAGIQVSFQNWKGINVREVPLKTKLEAVWHCIKFIFKRRGKWE